MSATRTPGSRRWLAPAVDLALEGTVVLSFSRVGEQVRRRLFAWPDLERTRGYDADGEPRVVLVTGATSGLGRATAAQLAGLGATVVITGRDRARTAQVRAELVAAAGHARIHDVVTDLARLEDVVTLAEQVRATHPRLDALVHNAGALVHRFQRTDDGLELTVQTHVVAPFLLTRLLLGLLGDTPGSRVVTVSSGGLYTRRLTSLDLGPEDFDGVAAYALAKRAQVVLTEQWARRTTGRGVAFHAMHPGWVDTPGLADSLPRFHQAMTAWLRTPDQGADTVAWLAVDPGVGVTATSGDRSGQLWLDRHRRWADKLPWTHTSAGRAVELWRWVSAQVDRFEPVRVGSLALNDVHEAGRRRTSSTGYTGSTGRTG